jgi:hypothetical protein
MVDTADNNSAVSKVKNSMVFTYPNFSRGRLLEFQYIGTYIQ